MWNQCTYSSATAVDARVDFLSLLLPKGIPTNICSPKNVCDNKYLNYYQDNKLYAIDVTDRVFSNLIARVGTVGHGVQSAVVGLPVWSA